MSFKQPSFCRCFHLLVDGQVALEVLVLGLDVDGDEVLVDRKPSLVRLRKSGLLSGARPLHRSTLRISGTVLIKNNKEVLIEK